MIKGINRQVVEVRETESEYFERILFFVKPEYACVSEGKIKEKASLISDKIQKPPRTRKKRDFSQAIKYLIATLSGVIAGISIMMIFG